MKIKCIHGFFMITELSAGQASDFSDMTGLELVQKEDYYTFKPLENAPDFSLIDADLLGYKSTVTYAGKPSEVFEANKVIYDFTDGKMKLIDSITIVTSVKRIGNRLTSPGLILPGSFNLEGQKIKGYTAWFLRDRSTWIYSEVEYV